jgi:hypothetical protein
MEQYWRMRQGLPYNRDYKEEVKETERFMLDRHSNSKKYIYATTNRRYSNEDEDDDTESTVCHDSEPTFIVKGM